MPGPSTTSRRNLSRRHALGLISCGWAVGSSVNASSSIKSLTDQRWSGPAEVVSQLLRAPEHEIDFLRSKVSIDRIVNASVTSDDTVAVVERMAATATQMAGPEPDAIQRLAAVRTLIYREGWWNDQRPFSYDLDDPFGKSISSKLLSTYLATRRGNCVSMPILFLILADKLAVNVVLSTAPMHVFVRYIDEAGHVINLETTSGALPARDAWIRQNMEMTDAAVENGVYLRTLSRRQSVAVMAITALEHLLEQRRWQDGIDVADAILSVYPEEAHSLVQKGTAFAGLLQDEFYSPYPDPSMVPAELRSRYAMLARSNIEAFAKAQELGWREIDGDDYEAPAES